MTNDSAVMAHHKPFSAGNPGSVEVEGTVLPAISDRARRLLSRPADLDVERKKSTSGLRREDFAGFANSQTGGAILLGVHAAKHGHGKRGAVLAGCGIGESERRKIMAMANQCVPHVAVSIFVENRAEKPFYRIEIPSGTRKPYCTVEGIYKIRNHGRNETLYPPQLLALFLEADDGAILHRLVQASASVGAVLQDVKQSVALEQKNWSESNWELRSGAQGSLRGPAVIVSHGESGAGGAGELPAGTAECPVRLSSQDLCGFLMRIP
ncbi:MAG: helix-turn-helix domain-containing protein [Bryobacteraceae bacterium]